MKFIPSGKGAIVDAVPFNGESWRFKCRLQRGRETTHFQGAIANAQLKCGKTKEREYICTVLTVFDELLDATLQALVFRFSVHHVPREGCAKGGIDEHQKREKKEE